MDLSRSASAAATSSCRSARAKQREPGQYTWWDYRQLSFPKNRGLRIDHILWTEAMAARCRSVVIDRDARKGQTPSDHAPVVAEFADL
jgi:exodeoxyribonuclease III